jgi:hypothetical protein
MYYLILTSIVFLLNFAIYSLLKNKESLWELFLYVIFIFFIIVFMERVYGYFCIKNMPNSYSFFVLLNFSWLISIMNLVKKYNNQRVNIYKQLNLEEYFGNISFLEFFTVFMSVFQVYLIFSKEIYQIV